MTAVVEDVKVAEMPEWAAILAFDGMASIRWSPQTEQFYVDARIEIGTGELIGGITEHRPNARNAVMAFFLKMQLVKAPEYLVTEYRGERREWRWNGGAFAECTRAEETS